MLKVPISTVRSRYVLRYWDDASQLFKDVLSQAAGKSCSIWLCIHLGNDTILHNYRIPKTVSNHKLEKICNQTQITNKKNAQSDMKHNLGKCVNTHENMQKDVY